MQQRLLPIGDGTGVGDQPVVERVIVVRAAGEHPGLGILQRARQPRQRVEADAEAHAACRRHLRCVADQPEAGDVRRGAGVHCLRRLGGDPIQAHHAGDRGIEVGRLDRAAFQGGGDRARAERLGQDQRIAGPRAALGEDALGMHDAGDRQPELRLLVLDRVPAGDRRAHRPHDLGSAAQDVGQQAGGQVGRESRQVEGEQHFAAHGVDVAQRVRRRDRAVLIRRVHDGREEVDRLDQRQLIAEPIHGRVVGRAQPHQQVRVRVDRE